MPRYYFHLRNRVGREDEQGQELPTLAAARRQAQRYLSDLLLDECTTLWKDELWTVEVTNKNGMKLLALHLVGADTIDG